jgi:hypothetical protein
MQLLVGFRSTQSKFAKLTCLPLLVLLLIQSEPATHARTAGQALSIRSLTALKVTVQALGGPSRTPAFVLHNSEKTPIAWSASADQVWLKFVPESGAVPPKGDTTIDMVADPEGFSSGVYEATTQIRTANGSQNLSVTMVEESAFSGVPVSNAERTFPPDSGMANVKQFGAKGDGINDDTAAIQQAISSIVHHPGTGARIIYFPAGTYLVSKPLLEKDLRGEWSSLLTLQGENRTTTTIKLSDNNSLYQNSKAPSDVVTFASQHGGRFGGGNQAFDNNIFDITIDVGRGNPGAVALNFMGNNNCALRNATLRSSDPNHAGAVALNMQRYAAGPCLMKNLVVNGFEYGIKITNNEYSLTFEDLYLLNQKMYGIYNSNNVLSIRHLVSMNTVPAILNKNDGGLITLLDAKLQGGSSQYSAIQNQGTLYLRNVSSSGYASVLEGTRDSSINEYDSGPALSQFGSKGLSLNLPVEETPQFEDPNLANWKSVVSFGADPDGKTDSAAAIQAAIDSGARIVYFPTGVYEVSRPILLRGKVRLLAGFDSSLNPRGKVFQDPSKPVPLLEVDAGISDVAVNHMRLGAFYAAPAPGVIGLLQNSSRPVVLRDSVVGGPPSVIAYQNTTQGTGTLFVENVTAKPWRILFPQKVFARQINPEGNMTKINNRGGRLWILGFKTEGTGTNIETEQGGATEVLGGLIYPVWRIPADTAGFVVNESRASFIYAVSNYKPSFENRDFALQIEEKQHGVTKSLLSTSLPSRGSGTMMPLYRSADLCANSSGDSARPAAPASSH